MSGDMSPEDERRRKRARYQRAYYHKHRDRILSALRDARASRPPSESDLARQKHREYCRERYRTRARERQREASKRWRAKNQDKIRERQKAYYLTTAKAKRHHLKKYGISVSDYERMLAAQGGVCAICRQPERLKSKSGRSMALAVDHCHRTGKVRGLLCRDCNQVLGKWHDDVEVMRDAIAYLTKE